MATYTYETLAAGAEALRAAAVRTACRQAAIDVGPDSALSLRQQQDLAMIEAAFAGVPAMFQPFVGMPAPDAFDDAIQDYYSTAHHLMTAQNQPKPGTGPPTPSNRAFALATTVSDHLASWSGAAAREFKANYLDTLPHQTASQFNATVACARALEQEQAIWRATRTAVVQHLNDAIDVMESLEQRCRHMSGWSLTLAIVAGVAAIAAPFATAGLGVAVALAIADGAGSAASAALSAPDPPLVLRFRAATAEGVIAEVGRGLNEIIKRVDEQESKLADVLAAATAGVHRHRADYVPKRPLLAAATGRNVTSPDYLGFSS